MPIEFLCPSCRRQLRCPDSAAGKKARCPACGTIVTIAEGGGGA
ncbi:MAG: TIGR00266 family protein, partial [Planctomycetota bacterium]